MCALVKSGDVTRNVRLIARLDVKGSTLIKGIHLEGLRKVGPAVDYARQYYMNGIDEILFMDAVASLYRRELFLDVVQRTAQNVFVPLTVGGGVRTVSDFERLLESGADKVALNSAALNRPALLEELATRFGSQSVVLSIEAARAGTQKWEALTDHGRERSGRDVKSWICQAASLGVGELLVTSVDCEGTRQGFDLELMKMVTEIVNLPIIASGGMGAPQHISDLLGEAEVGGIAVADSLHFDRFSISEIRAGAETMGVKWRKSG